MHGYPQSISTRRDLENLLADPTHHAPAVAYLQTLMDEQYGYTVAGPWGIIPGGGLDRIGITRAEAVTMGAADRVIAEPAFELAAYQAQSVARIEAECTSRCAAGIAVSWGDTGTVSRVATATSQDWTEIIGVSSAGLAYLSMGETTTQMFTDEDGCGHVLTPTQAMAMGKEVMAKYGAIKEAAHTAVIAVRAVVDPTRAAVATIDAIVERVGWPDGGNTRG